jgi:hypothetical protein
MELVRLVQGPERLSVVRGLVGPTGPIWTHPGLLAAASTGGCALERLCPGMPGTCLLAWGHGRLAGNELGLAG